MFFGLISTMRYSSRLSIPLQQEKEDMEKKNDSEFMKHIIMKAGA
jgi:hypothetical protein